MTWDAIAATVYRDTWHTLTCAEKGKRAKQLQNCVRPEDYEFLLEMDRCATTVQQGIHMLTTAAYKNQNSFIVKDMQAASKDLERNNQILVDREEELFLEYLLPEYNKLNSNHKRERRSYF
ncbi:hypothetical protein QE152_g9561 [Popillia japonica]|uniref:Uncharacterized protein n=1 Tax=Popillia japonica TaxID=7064 RepID=A0AAW1LZ12_POPJA